MYKHKCTEWFLNEEGYLEKSQAAYKANPEVLYDKLAGAGEDNYTKYGKEMHDVYPSVMDFPAYWCDAFVDNGFYKTYGVANAKGLLGGNFDDYTKGSINLYKSKNAFYLAKDIMPEEGDQIFFSKNQKFDGVHHTGYVYKVENGRVFTVEGNTTQEKKVVPNGGAVCLKSYSLKDTHIYGYGRPNYAKYETVRKEHYLPGEPIKIVAYLGRDSVTPVEGTLFITNDGLLIREQPDFSVRDKWFKTEDGYVSAYRVQGWIKDNEVDKWWYVENDFKYPVSCEKDIDGWTYMFDKDGYMLTSDRIAPDGHVLY